MRSKGRSADAANQAIPCIPAKKAAAIVKQCNQLLEGSKQTLADISRFGFGQFVALLGEEMLRLAVQPDSWGERMRARLMSDLAPALQGDLLGRYEVSIEDIAYCSNIVTPCLLLELGRRLGHIHIEFPPDPTNSAAHLKFRTGNATRVHYIDNQQLLRLASECGPALVGLCYFGDDKSREMIESRLEFGSPNSPRSRVISHAN